MQKDSTMQFTEEFDFEAMNEKFIKDEVWGHFGNAKQRDKTEGLEDNAPEQAVGEEEGYGLSSNFDPKPVYKKDDFFDTISCNSLNPKSKECTEAFCPSERISEALITGAGPQGIWLRWKGQGHLGNMHF